MELKTAIEILEYHQEWRLGKREDMIHEPKALTQALDIVLSTVKKLSLAESTTGYSCPNCGATCSDATLISRTNSSFEWHPDPHYSWDEFHKCQHCETLYLLHNGT